MHSSTSVDAFLRELEAARKSGDKKTDPNPSQTDWKALDGREYREEIRKQFGFTV